MSIGEGVRERVQGVRVPGTLTVAPGADATRSLDTCPTPSWDPAASPELGCSGGWRLGALGDGVGRLGGCGPRRRGLFAWGGGAYWGTPESSQATGPRGVALWEGRSMWMAAAVAWSASNPASCCQRRQRWGRVLALVGGASALLDPAPGDLASLPRDLCYGAVLGTGFDRTRSIFRAQHAHGPRRKEARLFPLQDTPHVILPGATNPENSASEGAG
ncbi:uncharacterized protein LOC118613650 isoform X2 [Rousettus aegyptiacus]|uniref:uncharacterized protein LOC118613650 isoform X2 n=1 Tax=Rousettus aegyptiacus TaxID=9407 RepID=UPI00168D4A9B|nr:uncharacterized protein LOC118613650 isoform X2 [Rousettus aegyptiacus]